jgi:hypothetical protein
MILLQKLHLRNVRLIKQRLDLQFYARRVERPAAEPLKTRMSFCLKIAASSAAPFAAHIQANFVLSSKI